MNNVEYIKIRIIFMLFNDLLNKNGVCWGRFFNFKICGKKINYILILFVYILKDKVLEFYKCKYL